jgi:hypothetical protein
MELFICFNNPYVIDDDTMEWFKNSEMLGSQKLKSLINYVIDDNPNNFKSGRRQTMGKSGRKPSTEMQSLVKSEQQTAEETLSFQFKNQYLLRFDPYEHRSLLVLAAIFFDSAEAYRCIVGATGFEFFMDLLVVNGSANIKKW